MEKQEDIIAVKALPCHCRHHCELGNKTMKTCPRYIARLTRKSVIMYYCKFCKTLTWHINHICVICRARAMGIHIGKDNER